MNKIFYIWKILKDRWIRPYDNIILRFNTKAIEGDPLVWRIFINNVEHLASEFEIHGYVYNVNSEELGIVKYNVGCIGRVRWEGTKAVIITPRKGPDQLV